jgi:hypothetical protein
LVEIAGADDHGAIVFADAAPDILRLDTGATRFGAAISGFGGDNVIDVTQLAWDDANPTKYSTAYDNATHQLRIRDGATTAFTFDNIVGESGTFVVASDGTGGTEIVTACYLRGTRIATLRGAVAVEDLRIGDLLVTAAGGAQPVKWIGTRAYIARLLHENHRAALLPIRIAAGALGEGCPVRDLFVSPEHMMCIDDVLIPAEKLLNGTSITRAEDIDVVQYFHVELSRHAVIYAEGAPAESYLDTNNRNMFSNVLEYLELGHDVDAPRQQPCLPVVLGGAALGAVRSALAARAADAGLATTPEAELRLMVDGVARHPERLDGDVLRFAVPAGARELRIVSRSAVLADLDPENGDRRRLGVCVRGLSLRSGAGARDIPLDHVALATGFHAFEASHRWTTGDAALPAVLFADIAGGFSLDVAVVATGQRYPCPPQAEVLSFPRAQAHAVRESARRSA